MIEHANSGKMHELKLKYDKSKNEKIELLERLILTLQQDPNDKHLGEFRAAVHNIGGSAGSFGYQTVSTLCKEMDTQARMRLESKKDLDKGWLISLDSFLDKVKLGFTQPAFKETQLIELRSFIKRPLLFIVDEDKQFLNLLERMKDQFFMDVITETEPVKALERLQDVNFKPDAVIVSQKFDNSSLTALDFADLLQEKIKHHPILFVLLFEENSTQQRVEASQKCFNYVLKKPIGVNEFYKAIKEALNRENLKGFRVLILDDDLDFCDYVSSILSEDNITVKAIHQSDDLFATLEEFRPHVLLLDLVLPKYDGLKLLKALRQDAIYNHLIIVVVTSSEEENTRFEAYAAKADDILYKPIDADLFHKRIFYLAERYALVGNEQQIIPKAEFALIEENKKIPEIANDISKGAFSHHSNEVFLIDPDDGLVRILKTAFEARGVKVKSFKEGGDVLNILAKESRDGFPALIIAERKLPDMDGLDLYKRLKSGPQHIIPFFFLTVFSSDKDVAEGLSQGVSEYIGKPFNVSILLQKALKIIFKEQ